MYRPIFVAGQEYILFPIYLLKFPTPLALPCEGGLLNTAMIKHIKVHVYVV